jgi:hypothetical protein
MAFFFALLQASAFFVFPPMVLISLLHHAACIIHTKVKEHRIVMRKQQQIIYSIQMYVRRRILMPPCKFAEPFFISPEAISCDSTAFRPDINQGRHIPKSYSMTELWPTTHAVEPGNQFLIGAVSCTSAGTRLAVSEQV